MKKLLMFVCLLMGLFSCSSANDEIILTDWINSQPTESRPIIVKKSFETIEKYTKYTLITKESKIFVSGWVHCVLPDTIK